MSDRRAAAVIALLASLAGGCGVALAAVAAHKVQVPALASAANMLMVHGAAGIALLALGRSSAQSRIWLVAAALIVAGSILFASAVSLPILASSAVLKGLAPVGGSTVMLGWAVAAFAAVRQMFDRD